MVDYYAACRFAIRVRDQTITVVGKPGVWSWDALDVGTATLLDTVDLAPDARVLDLGCGTGVIGAAAGVLAPRGHVTLADCNVTALACAVETVAANGLDNADARLADGVAGLDASSFDLVLSHLPRGRAVQEALIRGAAWVLRPGGRLYIVAHKRAGVKGAIAYARALFGRCGVLRQKKGYHVALALRPGDLDVSPPEEGYVTRAITVDGAETMLVSKPGVFAWDRLDDGTAALLAAMEINAADRVLDLGCGTGLAGLAAARRAPQGHVVLSDADVRAVESASRTLAANGIANAKVSLADCASAFVDLPPDGGRFDCVITNPPFHQGIGVNDEVACQFVRDAARVLRPGGRLYLVANRFLGYTNLVEATFGNVTLAYDDNRYHVLTAQK